MDIIKSTKNNQVKYLSSLINDKKTRKIEAAFIIEGEKMVLEAPRERLLHVFASESFYESGSLPFSPLNKNEDGIPVTLLKDDVFSKVSDTKTPQGVLAIVSQESSSLDKLLYTGKLGETPLILILEYIRDPGNLGTLIRSAAAAGADLVMISSKSADIYSPKTVRSTMGSIFNIPVLASEDLSNDIMLLKSKGIKVFAATLDADSYYYDESYTSGTAIIVGNESKGISSGIKRLSDCLIKIPMGKITKDTDSDGSDLVNSLNASCAGSVLLFEAQRQRRLL